MKTRIIIVNETDSPIGLKAYGTLNYEDIYRVSALWITDKEGGDNLLAQRGWDAKNDPGKWAAAVAGTVDEGETYSQNIEKEAVEELGLTGLTFETGPKQFIDDGSHKFFCQWFFASIKKTASNIKIQEEEVAGTKWISTNELLAEVEMHPEKYVPSAKETLMVLGMLSEQLP